MSTPKRDIFDKFTLNAYDKNIFTVYSENTRNILLDGYLNKAAALHFKDCRKDLTEYTSAVRLSETFDSDGVTYVISDYPSAYDDSTVELSCTVDGISVDYIFDKDTFTFTLSVDPGDNKTVVCGYLYAGEFESDLTDEEQWILALAMIITLANFNLYATDKMRDKIVTSDFSAPHSPAQLLKELKEIKELAERDVHRRIVSYTMSTIDLINFL